MLCGVVLVVCLCVRCFSYYAHAIKETLGSLLKRVRHALSLEESNGSVSASLEGDGRSVE